jgi:hypothetical protein
VALEQGSKFAIREGGLTVGAGVISKILDWFCRKRSIVGCEIDWNEKVWLQKKIFAR